MLYVPASVKYGNGSCTWSSSSYQQFALFVCDGDRQSVGLSELKDPIVTYLSQLHSEQEGGTDDTLLLLCDSTMF